MKSRIAEYAINPKLRGAYEDEVRSWIAEGWLVPRDSEESGGLLPMMAVEQSNKGKVRPVIDFRELNMATSSHTADSAVCGEQLRAWRRMGSEMALVDLRKAYLQIHVEPALWRYQTVKFHGQQYYLTRLGFGLNSAPRIMSEILRTVLSQDQRIAEATSHYIDDIAIDTTKVSVKDVVTHLGKYGLQTKPTEGLSGAKPLGLRVYWAHSRILRWTRGNTLPDLDV